MYLTKNKIFEYASAVETAEVTLVTFLSCEKQLCVSSGRFDGVIKELKRLFELRALQLLIIHLQFKVNYSV